MFTLRGQFFGVVSREHTKRKSLHVLLIYYQKTCR